MSRYHGMTARDDTGRIIVWVCGDEWRDGYAGWAYREPTPEEVRAHLASEADEPLIVPAR